MGIVFQFPDLRFVPTLLDETQKVMDAQRARGTVFGEGSLFQQMKKTGPYSSSLVCEFIKSSRGTSQCHGSPGYQSGKMRSTFRQLKWKNQDTICLLLMVVLTIGLVLLRAPGGLH